MITVSSNPKLELGQICVTAAAAEALYETSQAADEFVSRHQLGDWGDVTSEEYADNERSLRVGGEISSAYSLEDGEIIWIITNADRSRTTFRLAHEFRDLD